MNRVAVPTLASLCESVHAPLFVGDGATVISGISCKPDLGDVQPGVLFAPLDASPANVVRLSELAVARGAVALLLDRPMELPVPQVIVPNVRAALAKLAATFYGNPAAKLNCIGVTGTAGKTTATLLIDAILRRAGLRPGLVGTLEWRTGATWFRHKTERTTPEAPDLQRLLRQMVDAGDRWAILETSSQGLALHRVDAVPFSIGAITNVTQGHLDFHGTVADYRLAKAILFERVGANQGVAVVNADDPAARSMADHAVGARIVSYSGMGRHVDVLARDTEFTLAGARFTLVVAGESMPVTLPLLGEFNVANALCAAAVAHAVGASLAQIADGLENSVPPPGLLSRIDVGQPFTVLVDEAKSVAALVNALEVTRQLAGERRVIAVVSGSDQDKVQVLSQKGEVASLSADYAVFTTRRAHRVDPANQLAQMANSAMPAGGAPDATFTCIEDRREAIEHALRSAGAGDAVLIAGKGIEDTHIVAGTTSPWDETAIVRQILFELGCDRPS